LVFLPKIKTGYNPYKERAVAGFFVHWDNDDIMEIRTANTIVYCTKWKEVVAFYQTQLQLQVTTVLDWFVEFKLNDNACLSIADAARTSMASCNGKGITLTMEVDDIEATHSYLEEAGLHPPAIRDHAWRARVFFIYDPEGNRIEFWSQKKE
jgi:predicted enzyme related to lactoylglutathione lyase